MDSHLSVLATDIRFVIRSLRRTLFYPIAVAGTLGFGIGATSALLSVLQAALVSPLPFPNEHQLVALRGVEVPFSGFDTRGVTITDAASQRRALSGVAAYAVGGANAGLAGRALRVRIGLVTPGFFPVFGVSPALGRGFTEDEGRAGGANVAVISDAFWKREFGGDRYVIGRSFVLNGVGFAVVGVMPRAFDFPDRSDVWLPFVVPFDGRRSDMLGVALHVSVVARLRAGVDGRTAQALLNAVQGFSARALRGRSAGVTSVSVRSLRSSLAPISGRPLLFVFAAAALTLLLTSASGLTMALARAAARRDATRLLAALGATGQRLARLAIVEAALLAIVGGAVALVIGAWIQQMMSPLMPAPVQSVVMHGGFGRMLLLTLGTSAATAVVLGATLAHHGRNSKLGNPSIPSNRQSSARQTSAFARRLVVVQVSVTLVLVIAAWTSVSVVRRALEQNVGLGLDSVLVFRVSLPTVEYPTMSDEIRFYSKVLHRLSAIQSAEAVGLVNELAAAGDTFKVAFQRTPALSAHMVHPDTSIAQYLVVNPGYFRALRTRLVAGRMLSDDDDASSPKVVLINEEAARRYWPSQSPLGQPLWLVGDRTPNTIVGVVEESPVDSRANGRSPSPQIYASYQQDPWSHVAFLVRHTGTTSLFLSSIRVAIRGVDAGVPIYGVQSMADLMASGIDTQQSIGHLLTLFAALAIVVSILGTYGVMARAVAIRTMEIGIRLALGATPSDAMRLVLRDGLVLTAIGVLVGLICTFGLATVAYNRVYGVGPLQPAAFIGAVGVLITTSLLAMVIPGLRILRLDPAIAIRKPPG